MTSNIRTPLPGNPSNLSPSLIITLLTLTGAPDAELEVQGTYSIAAPYGLTGVWSPGGAVATISNFETTRVTSTFFANVVAPHVANTYTLTITGLGQNTGSALSNETVIS